LSHPGLASSDTYNSWGDACYNVEKDDYQRHISQAESVYSRAESTSWQPEILSAYAIIYWLGYAINSRQNTQQTCEEHSEKVAVLSLGSFLDGHWPNPILLDTSVKQSPIPRRKHTSLCVLGSRNTGTFSIFSVVSGVFG
jgi:hypothetical protein